MLELELDGCWGQLRVDRGEWCLRSRPGRDCGKGFAELAALAAALAAHRVILDGEPVCLGPDGKPDLHALRPCMLGRPGPAATLAFDVLHLDGLSTRRLPLARRREMLPAGGDGWWLVLRSPGRSPTCCTWSKGRGWRVSSPTPRPALRARRAFRRLAQAQAATHGDLRRLGLDLRPRPPARDGLPGPRGRPPRRSRAASGLTRQERERIRSAEAGLRVVVDFHGSGDRPLRDAVMRRPAT